MINFNIPSEDPIVHWPNLKIKDQNVLDLGCGQFGSGSDWLIDERGMPARTSGITSFYFLNDCQANKVVGVDISKRDIDFFNKINSSPNLIFIEQDLSVPNADEVIKNIIKEHQITYIKSDIEGHELLFLNFKKEDYQTINGVAIEYHNLNDKLLLLSHFNSMGFTLDAEGFWNNEIGVLVLNKNLTL